MKLLRALKSLLRYWAFLSVCAAALLVLSSVVVNVVVGHGMVYPTPETQSTFLKSYLPADVIANFDAHQGSSRGDGLASDAGRGFASHVRTIDFYFATRPQNTRMIPKALFEDSVLALRGNKMRVVDRSETPDGGYRIHYTGGKTDGVVTIPPVAPDKSIRRRMALSPGEIDVKAEIRVEEKWVKD